MCVSDCSDDAFMLQVDENCAPTTSRKTVIGVHSSPSTTDSEDEQLTISDSDDHSATNPEICTATLFDSDAEIEEFAVQTVAWWSIR